MQDQSKMNSVPQEREVRCELVTLSPRGHCCHYNYAFFKIILNLEKFCQSNKELLDSLYKNWSIFNILPYPLLTPLLCLRVYTVYITFYIRVDTWVWHFPQIRTFSNTPHYNYPTEELNWTLIHISTKLSSVFQFGQLSQ